MSSMRALLNHPLWHIARAARSRQRFFGRISGVFLAIALLALADGLIAQMRAGTNELDMLPGETLTLSGPTALKNPIPSDLRTSIIPPQAPLTFQLDGFFSGYWFGSGMWRGQIMADSGAPHGRWELRISFKGAGAQNIQKYILNVYPNAAAMQAASLSLLRRYAGFNPFLVAAFCAGGGMIFGIITYWYGTRLASSLHTLGLAQIYSASGPVIWCLAPPGLVPKPGSSRMILDESGKILCEARTGAYRKGKLRLDLLDKQSVPDCALVCLRHQGG